MKAIKLKEAVLRWAADENAEAAKIAIRALVAIGPNVAKETESPLVARHKDGTLKLQEFASAVEALQLRSDVIQEILTEGLQSVDHWSVQACARALCRTTADPDRTVALIIAASRYLKLPDRAAIDAIAFTTAADDDVLVYLVEALDSGDYWTRHAAIEALGSRGEKASRTIPRLKSLLVDSSVDVRRAAAKAIFRLTGDPSELRKVCDDIFAGEGDHDQWRAIEAIKELGPSGASFLPHVLTALRMAESDSAREVIEALQAIGTPEAIAELEKTAASDDWMLRSAATTALDELRTAERKGGN